MLFTTPSLDEHDRAVIAGIEAHREELRHFLGRPRRWRGQLRRNLRARAMRGSNSIEGIDVTIDDALALLEGEEPLDADRQTILEVTGYRNAMTYVQELGGDPHFTLDEGLLRSLHFMMLGHDLTKSPGSYRRQQIFVRDEDADAVVYEGPDAAQVPGLMAEFVQRMRQDAADPGTALVSGAMAHLNLVMIHPFRDGNGRMARCVQTMALARTQVLAPEFSSIEEWLGRNTNAYYDVLTQVGQGSWQPGNDAGPWLRFNLRAHHMQAQTVLDRVREAEDLWRLLVVVASGHKLPERTVSALYNAALGLRIRRAAYQEESQTEDATAGRDLKNLATAGLLVARGETRGRYYLGGPELVAIYRNLRAERPRRLSDPYSSDLTDLGPRLRRQVATTES